MIPVRQSTAFETSIGPVLDADGVAVTNGVVGDFKIKKTSGNFAALNGSATLSHVSAGVYDLVLTTSDTDTVGVCVIAIDDTVNACQSLYLQVMEEAIYDALYAASANTFTGAAGSSKVTGVVLVDTLTTYTGNTPQTGDAYAYLGTNMGATGGNLSSIPKTGYKLASDGLDSVATTAPTGVASNFREMLVQVWRRFFKKTVYDSSGQTIKTYADNGTDVTTTQTATSSAGVETQGPAT